MVIEQFDGEVPEFGVGRANVNEIVGSCVGWS